MQILSNLSLYGTLGLNSVTDANTDTDKFLVIDSNGIVRYRTGQELYNDIGAGGAAAYTSVLQHEVKAGVALTKGQAVYVTSADGTNMIVGKASNASEATSSKTLGLIAQDLAINGKGFVITEGLLSGLNTMAAGTEGDPVWLGTDGNLIYGLGSKPYAPDHLVFIGIVTRKNANNGEIFVKVQNGFELQELHNVQITSTPSDNTVLSYETSTSLYKMKSISTLLGYTPISLASLSASAPLSYNNTTGVFSISQANTSTNGYLSSTDWNTFNNKQNALTTGNLTSGSGAVVQITNGIGSVIGSGTVIAIQQSSGTQAGYLSSTDWSTFNNKQNQITLTTVNSSGSSTLSGNVLNIPSYTLAGLGGVPDSRTISINGVQYDLTLNRSWLVGTTTGSGSAGQIAYWNGSSSQTGSNNLFWDTSNNRLGIGLTNPQRRLEIYSSTADSHLRLSGSAPSVSLGEAITGSIYQAKFGLATSSGHYSTSAAAGDFVIISQTGATIWMTGTTDRLRLNYSGNFSIGNNNDTYKLDVSGNVYAISGSSSFLLSDTNGYARFTSADGNAQLGLFRTGSGGVYIGGSSLGLNVYNANFSSVLFNVNQSGAATFSSSVTASSFIKSGGTSSQFLKADGSVDANTYLTSIVGYVPTSRTITINGTTYDLSADRSWTVTASYTETDTLASVTGRGNTTNSSMAIGSGSIPNGRLYVNSGSATDVIALQNTLNTGAYLVFADNVTPTWANAPRLGAISNDMVFKTLDTERIRIASGGNVGINTASPSEKLHINGNAYISGVGSVLYFDTDSSSKTISQYVTNLYEFHILNGRGNSSRFILGNGSISLGTSATPQFYINTSSGNVGIGTTTTIYGKLSVSSGSFNGIRIDTNAGYDAISIGGTGAFSVDAPGVAGGRFYVGNGGNTGIGTNNPGYKLHVYTGDNEGIYLQGTGGGIWMNIKSASGKMWSYGAQNDGCGIYNRTDGVYRMFINDSGATTFSGTIAASNINSGIYASYIVQRDVNGYIYANYINFNTSESENPTISSFITSNGDGWSRKSSIAHVRNQLGNYGGWITGITSGMVTTALGYTPATSTHTHGLTRYSLAASGLIDGLTSANFRSTLFDSSTSGYNISTARWNSVPSGISGMNSYGTMIAWSGSDTHGFLALDYNTANAQIGGGYGDNISWKATLIHSSNIGSQSVNYASTVGINYSNDSNSTYQLLWGSGNSVYGTAGVYVNPYTDYVTATSFQASDWFRSSGTTGWYNSTYAVGIYAIDSTWVRTYNDAQFYSSTIIQAGASMRAPIFYDANDTTYYLDPNASSSTPSLNIAGNIELTARSASWAEGIKINVPSTSTWGGIRFTRNRSNADGNWAIGFTGIDSTDDLTFWSNNNGDGGGMRMRISKAGMVGIGTSPSGSYRLSVAGHLHMNYNSIDYVNQIYQETGGQGNYMYANSVSSYGTLRLTSSRNGWYGIYFDSGTTLMMNSNESGHYRQDYGWQYRWYNGSMYISTNSYGGGSEYTVLHTGNAPRASNSNLVYYAGFTLNADSMPTNSTGFTYSDGAPTTGPIVRFGDGNYDLEFNAYYYWGDSLYYRVRNGDVGSWRSWRRVLDDSAYPYAANMNQYLRTSDNPTFNVLYAADSIRFNQDVSADNTFGIYFSSNRPSSYGIYREGGSWSWPYPDLRIAFHTGIKMGANAGYGGMKFYSDYDMSSIVASINDGDTNMRGYYDIIAYASDRRLKENVQVIGNAVDKVKQLTGMTYTWNSVGAQYGWSPSSEREAGVFAQDVQAVLPEAVRLAPFDNNMGVSKSGQNFLTVKYEKIVPLLIEAIKEQQEQIEYLKSELNGLTK